MRLRSAIAALAVVAMFIGLPGCRNGWFRRDPVYYCQPACQPVCQSTVQSQPVVTGQPMTCYPQ